MKEDKYFPCSLDWLQLIDWRLDKYKRDRPCESFFQQKDALLDEIQVAKELSCSKKGTFENLAAKEICHKYQDRKALHWPATSAICLATAACVCLRKKNPDMTEVSVATSKSSRITQLSPTDMWSSIYKDQYSPQSNLGWERKGGQFVYMQPLDIVVG